jgi:hypothetical protein
MRPGSEPRGGKRAGSTASARGAEMARVVTLLLIAVAMAGCAPVASHAPSYLGLSDAAASEDDDDFGPEFDTDVAPALKRVPSNKVLGAMAFQKVTGRQVDPSRLSGGR